MCSNCEDDVMEMVQCVNAEDMPEEVEEWCSNREISTHYENGLHQVEDDGNPFSEWLKTQGFKFDDEKLGFTWVGVWGT